MTMTTTPSPATVLLETGLSGDGASGQADPLAPSDAQAARMIWRGALMGTPVVYVILAVIVTIAVPGQPGLLAVMVVPALMAGWYFGAVAALAAHEMRVEAQEVVEQERVDRPRPLRTFSPRIAH